MPTFGGARLRHLRPLCVLGTWVLGCVMTGLDAQYNLPCSAFSTFVSCILSPDGEARKIPDGDDSAWLVNCGGATRSGALFGRLASGVRD